MPSWIKGSFSVIHWNYIKRDNKSRTLKLPIPYNNPSANKLEDDTVKLTTSFQCLISSHICKHCNQIHTSACSRGIEAGVLPSLCYSKPPHYKPATALSPWMAMEDWFPHIYSSTLKKELFRDSQSGTDQMPDFLKGWETPCPMAQLYTLIRKGGQTWLPWEISQVLYR